MSRFDLIRNYLVLLAVVGVVSFGGLTRAVAGSGCAACQGCGDASKQLQTDGSFLTPLQLVNLMRTDRGLVVIDVRNAQKYAQGHIPGAINITPNQWRTPSAKPGEGDSQYIYRDEDGQMDIAYYENMLSEAGVQRTDTVVIYGNHAGKADGSIPAMLLDMLGQEKVYFLDGNGLEQWQQANLPVSTDGFTRQAAVYEAKPAEGSVWNLEEVVRNINNDQVIFYDTRSLGEWTGEAMRNNARGGHIPGAVHLDYYDMLQPDNGHCAVDAQMAKKLLEERGITKDKTIVLYCQTATRVSLPYLLLKDLGYEDVRVYDASWHEYGNREDTPIVKAEQATDASTQ